ncbi:cyclase [Umboniibacter marinipuniceus]|uniref:imidazole glycerol-phosphate synthase n=2 Tax=Umboniibacter marinipuniceus TaxID=569599 RepID=A0A3M0A584_9GAMM|nr:cyclase [Umboniibacter marinipuniceus]
MLRSRIIPVLLVRNKGLVKTTKFGDDKYVGDPINAVRIFNEKEADELTVFDIDASVNESEPDYKMIENLASECRMPLCYGGGVKTLQQALNILSLGVEKVALSSALISNPSLVNDIAAQVGNQSVVAVLDVKKRLLGGYKVFTHNGKKASNVDLVDFCKDLEVRGVGEIVINSIDRDGTMQGYDKALIKKVKEAVNVPVTLCGGASDHADLGQTIAEFGPIGVAAGSLFVFKGKYRAVLISYPNSNDKEKIFSEGQK